ncbi:TPA: hypothetical protein N0F65_012698 [Lagenidium giganteum]|uniref:Haloacid dehalogenase-like hydrolase n=1 Tax=Lagenidium giganteum TaxID=4803 RepID=A0AAV2YGE7_9STRA|nr:TPA: hypothetical protein N0F65_012698 [Lagenidium giganteum]
MKLGYRSTVSSIAIVRLLLCASAWSSLTADKASGSGSPQDVSIPFMAAEAPDYNNQAIEKMLHDSIGLRKKGTGYAVFDWDNTCMFGDISQTAVHYQVEHLNFRIPPSKFYEVMAMGYDHDLADACVPHGVHSVIGSNTQGDDVTFNDVLTSLVADYAWLYEVYIAASYDVKDAGYSRKPHNPPMSLEEVKQDSAYVNFRAKLAYLIFGLEGAKGSNEHQTCAVTITMTVLTKLLYGMTEAELRDMIRRSMSANLQAELGSLSFISDDTLRVRGEYPIGLRVFNGQETVMQALRENDIDVYVISASPQVFVEEAGRLAGLSYGVPEANIYGVRFQWDSDGKFTSTLVQDYPITWGPGKAQIVEQFLKPAHSNEAPLFASGDSSGDCEMLATVRDGVVHVNNRLKSSTDCIQ